MIKYESKEKLVKFDASIVDSVEDIILHRPKCKETVVELLEVLQRFFASKQEKEEVVTLEREETEDESISILGEDFVSKYKDILNYCKENELILYIHGTQPTIAHKILQEGLNYKIPSIESTAVLQNLDNPKYSNFLNWPHQHYEGLVLIGIPKESFGEIWNEKDNVSNQVTTYNYNIGSEFILGMLDIANKKVVQNPYFSINHNYDNLLKDNELSQKLYNYFNYKQDTDNLSTSTNVNVYQSSEDEFSYINDALVGYANSDINEFIDFSFEMILGELIKFTSYGQHIGKKTGWVRESEVSKSLETTRRFAKLLFEYKNHFIAQNKLDSYNEGVSGSCENDIEDFTIGGDWH